MRFAQKRHPLLCLKAHIVGERSAFVRRLSCLPQLLGSSAGSCGLPLLSHAFDTGRAAGCAGCYHSSVAGLPPACGLWYQGPCKQALQLTPSSQRQSASLVCSSQVAFALGGFALGALGCPPPRLLELAISLPQVVVEDPCEFRNQVVCSVALLEGHPPDRSGSGGARKGPELLKQHGSGYEAQAPLGQSRRAPPEYTPYKRAEQAPKHRCSI